MTAIEKLQTERQRLVVRLTQIDKILSQYDDLQRIAESYLIADASHTAASDLSGGSGMLSDSQVIEMRVSDQSSLGARKQKTRMADFERIVVDLLHETDKPLDRTDLYTALINRGVVIGSRDESSDMNALSARMTRLRDRGLVTNITGHGYWLKDRAFAEAGYEAKNAEEGRTPTDLSNILSDLDLE